ncbi:hypothetical protein KVR01_007865 [Diaporthe batatas]|uniref:uncharacterized protein n=1 Tax=Diaporthe batatas TaxID=748121 RepID=UPI001D05000A|nr:uncharacterized protein KVR01_007865 [Diaporthe batatas]KAG8162100.1 hypothetical protein KVR01_007865 [Diaporthe batatas]
MTHAELMHWADTVRIDDLIAEGLVSAQHVMANDTLAEVEMDTFQGAGMPLMGANSTDTATSPLPGILGGRGDVHDTGGVANPLGARQTDESQFSETSPVLLNTSDPKVTPLIKNATLQDLDSARRLVEDAIEKSSELNMARFSNPRRNIYALQPGTVLGSSAANAPRALDAQYDAQDDVPALLEITDDIAEAAALVSEADALGLIGNFTGNITRREVQMAASGSYWMEALDRKGTVPWGDDPAYKVFRNVRDYGAVGDGVTDDTKAIKNAMSDQKRCAKGCNGSTTKNAIIYFPPGSYRISTTIPMPFGTQVIGDANNWPTLIATKSFIGLGVLSTDEYTGGGIGIDGADQQYYVNTANFYRQIRNIRIDITQTRPTQGVACLHYQVAQATSLQDVELIATKGTKQRGIFAENGSGGAISDVTFRGGGFGIYGGNQQFTAQRLKFDGCDTGVQVIWDWGWVWKSITMSNVGVGFRLLREETSPTTKRQTVPGKGGEGNIGSASFIDSTFQNVGTAILIAPPDSTPGSGSTGVIVENVKFEGVSQPVADTSGSTLLSSAGTVDHWALGPVYNSNGTFSMGGKVGNYRKQPGLLDNNGAYFERAKPQYKDRGVGDFLHVKDFGALGDGSTDDTAAFQQALWGSQGKILFVDAGSYILTGTVTIPLGSKIVGETWSQLVASGPYFSDASNPKVMIKVGTEGEIGDIEMQDLLFTTKGPTAGAILVEWNVKAESPGSAGLWDCHARIGGATGTGLTPAECPALTSGIASGCNAASLMMHITPRASGYFENMWLWGADHMIDDPDLGDANNTMVQNSVYVARGLLVESVAPTWLYGTASEHAVYYQYNFHNAQNVFAGMIQTESPYFQPTPKPPMPFEKVVGTIGGDPDYNCTATNGLDGCDSSWGVMIRGSANIFIAGAGLYSWFSTYTQDCIDKHSCQKALLLLEDNFANVRIQQLITIGAEYMAVQDGVGIPALDYLNVETHPRWSQLTVLDAAGDGSEFGGMVWIDPKIWDMDTPTFSCAAPCLVKIPPWTGATSTVDYPRITVSQGTWTSTITRAPLTLSHLMFEPVTLRADAGNLKRRQGFSEFWPVPTTTPYWPPVTYTEPDGAVKTTAPTIAFPKPPATIGPGAPAPWGGRWPRRAITPIQDPVVWGSPAVGQCSYLDFNCVPDPWTYTGMGGGNGGGGDDGWVEEDGDEDRITCAPETTITETATATTTVAATITEPAEPEASPMEHADASKNVRDCYDAGQDTTHVRLDEAINSFCKQIGDPGDVLAAGTVKKANKEPPSNGGSVVEIVFKLEVKEKCEWSYDYNECVRYLGVPVDSCNCGGINGKQGGTVENNCLYWRVDPNKKW